MNINSREKRRRAEYRRRKRIRILLKRLCVGLSMIVVILLAVIAKQQLGEANAAFNQSGKKQEKENGNFYQTKDSKKKNGKEKEVDYAALCGLSEVEKPVKRDAYQVEQRLKELGEESELIKEIYENISLYPEKLLEALANNPEMAHFVNGYAKKRKEEPISFTETEKKQEYPLFLQWDPRWGYEAYGKDSNIALAGCGPTSLSMVLYYLTDDDTITPAKAARYSMDNGYYMEGTGTAWALMEDYPALYGIGVKHLRKNEQAIKNVLDQGGMIICAMREGDFTAEGHFIVIYGYDGNGFKVNDPNCVARSRKSWSYERIQTQIKNIWAFSGDSYVPIIEEEASEMAVSYK